VSSLDDRLMGYVIFIGCLLGIACYFYLVFLSPWILLTIKASAFVAVAAMLAIMAWMGYTLAGTPPPISLEDFEKPVIEEESSP